MMHIYGVNISDAIENASNPEMADDVISWANSSLRVMSFEERHAWAQVRLWALQAKGADADSLEEAAKPYAFEKLETRLCLVGILEEMGEFDRALPWLECLVRPGLFPRSTPEYEAEVQLLRIYSAMGLVAEREYTKELLTFPSINAKLPAAELLRRYKSFWAEEEWPAARDELFAEMVRHVDSDSKYYRKIGLKYCDCLVEEDLGDRLVKALEPRTIDFKQYEDYLLQSGHSDFLVSRWLEIVEERCSKVEKKSTRYEQLAKDLAHLAALPGGERHARKIADELIAKYPNRPALHRELKGAGF